MSVFVTEVIAIQPKTRRLKRYEGPRIIASGFPEAFAICDEQYPYCEVVAQLIAEIPAGDDLSADWSQAIWYDSNGGKWQAKSRGILTPKGIQSLVKNIYDGKINKRNLPVDLYDAIADRLKKGAYKGYGISYNELTQSVEKETTKIFDNTDVELLGELRDNIYMFSAAKTYQQVREMSDLIMDGDSVRPFNEFKEEALNVYDTYNESWLEAEYNTAIAQATSAVQWNEIQKTKDALPSLQYQTIGDACDICGPMDGVVKAVDDPFWDVFMPPNHFNCMCIVSQEGDDVEITEDAPDVSGEMDDDFKMNPGKDKVVFNEDHPYFTTVPKEDKNFAKTNFGLDIPETD